jgi:hypothetical protein
VILLVQYDAQGVSWCESDTKGPECRTRAPDGEFAIGITVRASDAVVRRPGQKAWFQPGPKHSD